MSRKCSLHVDTFDRFEQELFHLLCQNMFSSTHDCFLSVNTIQFFIGKNRNLKYLFAFDACLRNTLVETRPDCFANMHRMRTNIWDFYSFKKIIVLCWHSKNTSSSLFKNCNIIRSSNRILEKKHNDCLNQPPMPPHIR